MSEAMSAASPAQGDEALSLLSPDVLESYDRLKVDVVRLDLPHVAVVRFVGDDRKGWLQGQVTNNLRSFDAGSATSFCFCAATGHLQATVDAWAFPDFIVGTMDASAVPAVLDRVAKMVIMENVEAEEVTQEYRLISIQGPRASEALSGYFDLPTLDCGTVGDALLLRSNRTGMGGWDVLLPAGDSWADSMREEFAPLAPEAYEIARLEAGIPVAGRDSNERTLPPELGPQFIARHISYNKGCYMGQEVLMRIHSRGHTNRTWMALLSEHPLQAGDLVRHTTRPDAGVVTSAVYSPDYGYLAGAMLRNEAAVARDTVTVSTERGEVEAEVRAFPVTAFE